MLSSIKELFNKISSLFEKDVADEFRERVSNPFYVALAFSWSAWNWRLIFTLFNFDDQHKLADRITLLSGYINAENSSYRLLWCPIGSALLAILLFALLKQVALAINMFVINRIQPLIYKKIDDSKIVTRDKYDKLTKRISKIRIAYEEVREQISSQTDENQSLSSSLRKISEENDLLKTTNEELEDKIKQATQGSLLGLFEGTWINEHILPSGEIGSETVTIQDGVKYFANSRYSFNLDMIEFNQESKTIKFRKVGLPGDPRKVVNELYIESEFEYRGLEENNILITYSRLDKNNQILNFTPKYKRNKINFGENSQLIFEFSNISNTGLLVTSYSIKAYRNRNLLGSGTKREFKLNVAGNASNQHAFNLVNPVEYYFYSNGNAGTYDSEITITYIIDGTTEIKSITRTARLVVNEPLEIKSASYGYKDQVVDVTDRVKELISDGDRTFHVNTPNLVGKFDPAPDAKKIIHIHYHIDGNEKAKYGHEGETIKLD